MHHSPPRVICLLLLCLLSATFLFMIVLSWIHCCCCGKPKYQVSRVQPLQPIWSLDRDQTPQVNQHPSFVFMWWPEFNTHGLYLQLNVYFFSSSGSSNLGGNDKRGIIKERMATYFLDIPSNEIKTGSTSRLSCQWNPCKSAEWHTSSRLITRRDNETLCGSLFQQQKPHCGGI